MSPLSRTQVADEGTSYTTPFIGQPPEHTVALLIDLSTLSTDEVDADGYLKPGVPIQLPGDVGAAGAAGALVSAADERAGVVVEATKVADDNANLATDPDVEVAIGFQCAINRAILEDTLGRVLTAAEITALQAGNVEVVE